MKNRKSKKPEQIEKQYVRLEKRAAVHHPGIFDVLRVYGGAEEALKQAQDYLAATNPEPIFTTSDSSN